MEMLKIKILNPKARSILQNLDELNLIQINPFSSLSYTLEELRRNEKNIPSLEEITQEVEAVRQKRYENNN